MSIKLTAWPAALVSVAVMAQQPGNPPQSPTYPQYPSATPQPPASYPPSGYAQAPPTYPQMPPAYPPQAPAQSVVTPPASPPSSGTYPAGGYSTVPAYPPANPVVPPAYSYPPAPAYRSGATVAPASGYGQAAPNSAGAASIVLAPPSAQPAMLGAPRPADAQSEPYQKHEDTRNGHNQVYPDRGAIVRDLPRGATVINYAGTSYWFCDGVWFEPRGPAFIVVAPPIGLIVPTLPSFATAVVGSGRAYLYANDVYYRPRPDIGGYEVVNDPVEPVVESESASTPGIAAVPVTPVAATLTTATSAPVPTPASLPIPTAPASAAALGPPGGTAASLGVYPRNGQTPEEQARDRYECYRFAVTQTGFDPLRTGAGMAAGSERQSAYDRAQAACFEGRGYAVN
jgi:hypothetical protein